MVLSTGRKSSPRRSSTGLGGTRFLGHRAQIRLSPYAATGTLENRWLGRSSTAWGGSGFGTKCARFLFTGNTSVKASPDAAAKSGLHPAPARSTRTSRSGSLGIPRKHPHARIRAGIRSSVEQHGLCRRGAEITLLDRVGASLAPMTTDWPFE